MSTYDKKQFKEYLSTKVAESTAKTYATDMAVCVKALEKIKLYKGKELSGILEDFVSHKKDVKNYLQDEFLKGLSDIGSNDSGLYDSLLSKAKHYLTMINNSSAQVQESQNIAQSNDAGCIVRIKLTGIETNNMGDEIGDPFEDTKTIYEVNVTNCSDLSDYDVISEALSDKQLLEDVWNNWAQSSYDYFYINYLEMRGNIYNDSDEVDEFCPDLVDNGSNVIRLDADDRCCLPLQ